MKTYSISNILVLIFWIFLIFLFLNELFGKQNETFKNTNKTVKNTNKIKVYNFNTTWCGHSKNFQPIWDKFAQSIDNTDNITIIDAKCDTNTNDNLVKKYNVEGYPTVIIDVGDKFTTYSGERSVNGLRKALSLPPIMENTLAGTNHRCGNNVPVNKDKIKIFNFNTTWCGHSIRFQPIWDKFAKSIDTTNNITIIDAKCDTNINDELVKKYNIEGYPTVIIDDNGKITKYSGERSVNGLRKALNLPPIMENKFGNNAPVNNNKTKIFNFNTSWCGYSVRFQPIWDQFTQQVVDANVEVIDVKCDNDDNAELCKKYDVPGYPSVLKVKPSGEVINYDGPRTVEGLLDFIKN
jgi:thiol-disulfide isomerase/thioredoxin